MATKKKVAKKKSTKKVAKKKAPKKKATKKKAPKKKSTKKVTKKKAPKRKKSTTRGRWVAKRKALEAKKKSVKKPRAVKPAGPRPRSAAVVAAGLPAWEWPIRWSELSPSDVSTFREIYPQRAAELGGPDSATELGSALGWGLSALGDDFAAPTPSLLEPIVAALPKAWKTCKPSDLRGARSLIIASATLEALGFDVPSGRELRAAVRTIMKERKRDLEWVDRDVRAELSAALCYFDFFKEATVWSDAGKLLMRPTVGAAYSWSVGESLRYLASAYAAGTSQQDTQPAFSAFVQAFPRKLWLDQTSVRALLIAAGDRCKRFHPETPLGKLLAAEGVRAASGLGARPEGYDAAEQYPNIKQDSFDSWRAAATSLRRAMRVTSRQLYRRMHYRRSGLNLHVTRYMATLGLVGQLQGHLGSHLVLMADLLPPLVERYVRKSEYWADGIEPLLVISLLEAFGLEHPPELSFPLEPLKEWAKKCRAKKERPRGYGRPSFDLAAAAYLGRDSKWWSNPPSAYQGEFARVTAGEFLRAFHDGSPDARALGVRLIEEIPHSRYFTLANALLVARAISVHLDGKDPSQTGALLSELTELR